MRERSLLSLNDQSQFYDTTTFISIEALLWEETISTFLAALFAIRFLNRDFFSVQKFYNLFNHKNSNHKKYLGMKTLIKKEQGMIMNYSGRHSLLTTHEALRMV